MCSNASSLVEGNLFGGSMENGDLLLHRLLPCATLGSHELEVLSEIQAQSIDERSHHKVACFCEDAHVERCESCKRSDLKPKPEERDVVVRGQDIGDLPAEYVVRGLRSHEMAVIGVYVDPRIIPGFRYHVRRIGTDSYLFGGRALVLQSIGMGYGKRLTFAGDSCNFNDNYFWSDSEPSGFALSPDAVQPSDQLSIYGSNGSGVIGEVKVERVHGVQDEISSEIVNGNVGKRVRVTLECSVTYFQQYHHGMVSLKVSDMEHVTGEAVVIKRKGSRVATLDCIHNVVLACIPDVCTLQMES